MIKMISCALTATTTWAPNPTADINDPTALGGSVIPISLSWYTFSNIHKDDDYWTVDVGCVAEIFSSSLGMDESVKWKTLRISYFMQMETVEFLPVLLLCSICMICMAGKFALHPMAMDFGGVHSAHAESKAMIFHVEQWFPNFLNLQPLLGFYKYLTLLL